MSTRRTFDLSVVSAWAFASLIIIHAVLKVPVGLRRGELPTAIMTFGIELMIAAPAIGAVQGISWCRTLMRLECGLFIPLWLLLPIAQHEIDRTLLFWCLWALYLLIFILGAVSPQSRHRPGP